MDNRFKGSEDGLKKAAEDWQKTFDSSRDMIMLIDSEMTILKANRTTSEFLNVSVDELIGKKCHKLFHGIDSPLPACPVQKLKETGKPDEIELFLENKGIWCEITADPIYDKSGKLTGIVHTIRDITERKHSEEAQRKAETCLRVILESVIEGILSVDVTGKTIMTNKKFAELWRIPQPLIDAGDDNAMLDFVLEQLIDPVGFLDKVKTLYKTPELSKDIISFKDGRIFERYSAPMFYEGTAIGRLWSFLDVTEGKKAEDILKRDNEELERLVQDRTKKLIAVTEEVEKARRLSDIGVLAATVAHELRNPLAAIGVAAYNIKKKAQDPLLEPHLANISDKIAESDQIISNLLFYSRLKVPQLEIFDLCDCLNGCTVSVTGHSKKKVSVVRNFSSIEGKSIQADPLQMKEMFTNILMNALDAVRDETGVVEVNGYWGQDGFVKICFKDNGVGIDEEGLRNIFQPFYTTKAKGTGLGMTVCKQVVDLHNGTIDISSRKSEGTTVTIALPERQAK